MKYMGKDYKKIILIGPSGSGKSWTTENLLSMKKKLIFVPFVQRIRYSITYRKIK
jgi:guanylate kinase